MSLFNVFFFFNLPLVPRATIEKAKISKLELPDESKIAQKKNTFSEKTFSANISKHITRTHIRCRENLIFILFFARTTFAGDFMFSGTIVVSVNENSAQYCEYGLRLEACKITRGSCILLYCITTSRTMVYPAHREHSVSIAVENANTIQS